MARDPKYDLLFEPIQLGPKLMPNRFWQVPHCMGGGSDNPGFQAGFRGMKAEGGWGAIFTESTSISPDSDIDPLTVVRLWDAGDVRNLQLTTDSIHAHGALAGVELFYGGAPIVSTESRQPNLAPSQMITDGNYIGSVIEMDLDDVKRVQQLYVAAALRARDAGFDLISLHCAHAVSVMSQFFIPVYNRRSDQYGGIFENRARFSRETAEAVRAAVGGDCAIGVRFGLDTLPDPYGLGATGTRAEADGHEFLSFMDDVLDYWDLNVSALSNQGEDIGPSRTHRENHQQVFVGGAKNFTSKPVINVGRFTSPDTMAKIIREGQCDIVGAARPSIADPFLPLKIREGRLDDIRECIGCNMCISKFEQGSRIVCTQNATSGEEYRRGWHPEHFTRAKNWENDVLVVGAGPAGMECAMVLGKRGMRRVHMVDAEAAVGGALRWVSQLPGLGEWARVIDYRTIQIAKLPNVATILGERLSAADVLDYGAEIVVVATGARWADDGRSGAHMGQVPGADSALVHVLTPEQVMVENKPIGRRVTVFDAEGYFTGYLLAERLARLGHEVSLVTNHHLLSPYSTFTVESQRVNRGIREVGVNVVTDHCLVGVRTESVSIRNVWMDKLVEVPTDSTVLVTQRYSADSIYRELKSAPEALIAAGITKLYRIGSCAVPNFLAESIFSGHRLGREIDSADPSRPLPHIRERRLLDASENDYLLGSAALSPLY